MEISKSDWNLYRSKLPAWQEAYMEKLCREYAAALNDSSIAASDRFWALYERIREDKRRPGVLAEVRKANMPFDIAQLLADHAISSDDLSAFSQELQDKVTLILRSCQLECDDGM